MIYPLIITCEVEPDAIGDPVAILKLNGEEFYRGAPAHNPSQARHAAHTDLLEVLQGLMEPFAVPARTTEPDEEATTTAHGLQTGKPPPSGDPHGITPNKTVVYILKGSEPMESETLGWLPSYDALDSYDGFVTPDGPARFVPLDYEHQPRTWATICIGKFTNPNTDEVVGWAMRYYR